MPASSSPLATAPLRETRARMVEHLGAIAARVGALGVTADEPTVSAMRRVVADLAATLGPHLEWEERTVHPIVDKYACEGPAAFSASMRYEHEVIRRWLAELRDLAEGPSVAFARRADNLLGVVLAHFELEEHVLFPILDRSVSPAALGVRAGEAPARPR